MHKKQENSFIIHLFYCLKNSYRIVKLNAKSVYTDRGGGGGVGQKWTAVDRGGGGGPKMAKNVWTSFMDGP